MWQGSHPFIFEDEDEEALKAEYVKLRALYPNRSSFEIANYVFRNLVEPTLRAGQAADIWDKDLDVLERISNIMLNGEEKPVAPFPDKIERMKQILKLANNPDTPVKEQIAAHRLVAEMASDIAKNVNKTVEDKRPPRTVVIAQYDD